MPKLYHYKNMNSLRAKILNFISWWISIFFSIGGTVITAMTGKIQYLQIILFFSVVFFITFQKLSALVEEKETRKTGRSVSNQRVITKMETPVECKYKMNDHVFLNDHVSFGNDIFMFNSQKCIIKNLIRNHEIVDFPGLIDEEEWKPYWTSKRKLENRVNYRTEFVSQSDGTIQMIWQIQPDGRYWADESGFGMGNDDEIDLYSFLDDEGRFLQSFRYYRGKIT